MKHPTRFALFLVLAALLSAALPVLAQDATAEPTAGVIILIPHTFEAQGIESVVPDGWTDLGNGIFARQQTPADNVLIAQQAAPLNRESLLSAVLPQLGLTEAPESTGTHDGLAFSWTLYQVDITGTGLNLIVDLALAEVDHRTYLVLLQAPPEEHDALHASVFMPTLDAAAPYVEETSEELVPYIVEEVTFDNGDVTLAGTLTLPPDGAPHAAVVLVSGSGPQDRDESLGAGIPIKPFRLLADQLTRAGIAVLRYDDRGVGESTGVFAEATTADFATDAAAAIDYLAGRDDIDRDQIGLIGHSEGGLVAAMLGADNEELDFIISLAGPGVAGSGVLLLQNRLIAEASGMTPDEVEAQVAFIEQIIGVADDPETIEALTYERALEQIAALPDDERASISDPEQYARTVAAQLAQQYTAGWFASFLNYNPATDWARTTVPVLAIFGGKDLQVHAEQNAGPLEAALAEAGNEDVTVVTLPDANHLFQAADTGSPTEYATLPAEFTPDLIPTIVDWLAARVDLDA